MAPSKNFKKLSKKVVQFLNVENVLAVLFAIFIVFNLSVPQWLVNIVNNIVVQVILGLSVICLFFKTNPIVGILGLLALYELIKRAKYGGSIAGQYQPSEYKKQMQFESFNKWPKTLEEDVISKMAPLPSYTNSNQSYKPDEEPNNGSVV